MTHTAHNYQLMYDASRTLTNRRAPITNIHIKINLRASVKDGLKTVLPFYSIGAFRFKNHIK